MNAVSYYLTIVRELAFVKLYISSNEVPRVISYTGQEKMGNNGIGGKTCWHRRGNVGRGTGVKKGMPGGKKISCVFSINVVE